MDEKHQQQQPPAMSHRRARPLALLTLLFVFALTFWRWPSYTPAITATDLDSLNNLGNIEPASTEKRLVPLEAHIISKCPDTRDAFRQLLLPVMQQVSDKVNFTLSYIGSLTDDDGVECKHGPSECLGNIIELCARDLYPDPKISLGFIMCLTNDYSHIPERALIEDCALEHAIDFDALNECAAADNGAHGMDLLRTSVQRSADAGVSISCTIRLDGETYCIRDGFEWTDCPHGPGVNDLILAIEKLHRS